MVYSSSTFSDNLSLNQTAAMGEILVQLQEQTHSFKWILKRAVQKLGTELSAFGWYVFLFLFRHLTYSEYCTLDN